MEVSMDECVSGEEVLCLMGRFQTVASVTLGAASADVSSQHDYSGIDSVDARHMEANGAERHRSFSAVSHDRSRHILQPRQQPPEEALGNIGIAPVLNKDVEHNAVLIDGMPEIVLHALDPDEHLFETPLVPGPRAQAVGKALAEFRAPPPHGLIGDDNDSLSQKQLNVMQAEAERMIQPDCKADDLVGEPMAVVRVWWWLHALTFVRFPPPGCQTLSP
jgi:hypothetical protein